MARRRNDENITRLYFNGSVWTDSPTGATIKLIREKVWSYSQYSTNTLYRLNPEAPDTWTQVTERSELSGLERGHFYRAYPREKTDGGTQWMVILTRVGDEELLDLGISYETAIKTDFELILGPKMFSIFQKKVTQIGGIVQIESIDLQILLDQVTQAEGLRQALETLLGEAKILAALAQPGASTVIDLEQIRDRARTLDLDYVSTRNGVRQMVEGLLLEPGRSDEKAQAQAWLLQLQDSLALSAISALLKATVATRALLLAGGMTVGFPHPKMVLLHEFMNQIYQGTSIIVSFDGIDKITLKQGRFGESVALTPANIE